MAMNAVRTQYRPLAAALLVAGISTTKQSARASAAPDAGAPPLARFSPISPIRIFRPRDDLEIAFDVRTRNPVYVLQRLTGESKGRSQRRHFYEERSLPEVFRSRNAAYHLSGYDRGHLAPAADYSDNRSTYNLMNVSPQAHGMNHQIWSRLEEWTRQVARRYQVVYVVTGPLWLPQRQVSDKHFVYEYPAIGRPPSLVAVPTHFFKVVAVINENRIVAYACFVVENADHAGRQSLEDCLVRWSDLEAVVGLEFFPTLVDAAWKSQADGLVECGPRRLLLTEGASSSRSSTRGSVNVRHLCPNGSCQWKKHD